MLDISIVLHNSERHLENLISSLIQQAMPLSDISLLIYDNNSSDNTLLKLQQLIEPLIENFQSYHLIEGKQNIGFGRAHNLAIAQGCNDYIFILNPDTQLSDSCIPILMNTARNDTENISAWEARQSPYEHPKIYNPMTLETSWVSAAAVLVRRSIFEQIDGFDHQFFLYGEDVDLSWRLRDAGTQLRYIPDAVLTHNTYQDPSIVKPLQFIGSIRANLYLRTRFGNLRSILKGFKLQLLLLRGVHQQVKSQRRLILQSFAKWLIHFKHFRHASKRQIQHQFFDWEYEYAREGAYYDISPCLTMNNDTKVSILIRTIGKQKLLSQALACIVNQTYKNIEVVIVEDGSESLNKFLIPYRSKLDINYQALGINKGRCHAGNQAMENAKGEFYLFLDEDDLLYADHIEQLLIAVKQHKARVAYSFAFELPSVYEKNGDGIVREGNLFGRFKRPFSFLKLLHANYLPINTILFSHSLYEECGGFDPEIDLNEDWNLWVRFSIQNRAPFINVPKTTAIYRVPLEEEVNKERHKQLLDYQQRVRKLQSTLKVELTVEELLRLTHESD
ncbi:MAG: glycosyltransferase family 2 protein [gamma proteobacterium symbiont of Taylorina sp.]|nr:glycosyltransferase family 2 protein [gamma proteobacterium symbiont of Taylorina sp.]